MGKIVNNVYIYTYILFILLCNGSVFFGVKFGSITAVAFIGISIVILLSRKKIIINRYCLQTFFIFSGLLLVSNVINIRNGVNWISLLMYISQLIVIYIFQSSIDVKDLYRAIINSMFVICIISLVTFTLYEYNNGIFQRFIIRETIHSSSYVYIYSIWHTFGWNVNFHRNAGPYWEAGLFACFIAIALTLLLFGFSKEEFGKKDIIVILLCL